MSIPILGTIIIGLIIGVIYVTGITKKWGMLVPFAGLFFFSSIALPMSWNDQLNPTVWLPVQSLRSKLFLGAGIAGMLVLLIQIQRLKGKSIPFSAILLVCIGFYASLLRFVHGGVADGFSSISFSFFTLIPLVVTAALVLDEYRDLRLIFRSIMLINIVWIGMVFVQIAVNSRYVTQGNEYRFVGLLSNPQHSGVLMAFLVVITLWMVLNDTKKYKLIYIGLLSINGIFLLWTGSRTGLGMGIIGVSAVFYSRAGRAILILPMIGLLGYISMKLMVDVVGIDLGFERMTSTKNTRTDAWRELFVSAQQNPMVGIGMDGLERSENSWLYGFASYGIGMLFLLLLMTFVSTIEILKSIKARFSMPQEYRPSLDVLIGLMLMYFAGAILEGFMVSRVSVTMCIFMVAAVGNISIRKFAQSDGHELYDEYEEYDNEEREYAYEEYENEYDGYGDETGLPAD